MLGEAVLGHGFEEAPLVAEEPVDRGRLHARGGGDGAPRQRVAAAISEALGTGRDDPRAHQVVTSDLVDDEGSGRPTSLPTATSLSTITISCYRRKIVLTLIQ